MGGIPSTCLSSKKENKAQAEQHQEWGGKKMSTSKKLVLWQNVLMWTNCLSVCSNFG